MTPERWQEIERVCQAALERDVGARAAFLAEACGADAALRQEVESLLAQAPGATGFLSTPAAARAGELLSDGPSLIGRQLGPYAIVARLGAGGMGEVYRARDSKLGRDVAIKILPSSFASDPERLARFEREARVLASLNHPHIGAIYGLEAVDGTPALVLELVDGDTLAERLAKPVASGFSRTAGGLPIAEAFAVALQVAEALGAAHERGIVHRDLKPANIKITAAGVVKVLDFGLAKAAAGDASNPDLSQSPGIKSGGTREGVILGTAEYMSPEQARGQAVDKRTDIWAFGVVLFEMLAGKRPFVGRTVTDILAAVLERQPDLDRVPARVRPLLRRCLEKDPNRRLRDIGDAMAWLDQDAPMVGGGQGRLQLWSAASAVFVLALGVALWAPWRTPPPAPAPILTQILLPPNVDAAGRNFKLSPDSRILAFSAVGSEGVPQVWVRFMDSLEVRPLSGTETLPTPPPFFWSPDSRFIAYAAKGAKLRTVDLTGSPPQTMADVTGINAVGGSWSRDGVLIYGSAATGLMRVSAGGMPSPVTALDVSRKETRHAFPTFLSDGRYFLYLRTSTLIPENSGVYMGSLDVKPEDQNSTRLVATAFGPVYVPSAERGRGYLLILREGNVLAYAFDEARMALVGDPMPVVQQFGALVNSGFFSASGGVLVYRSSGANQDAQLQWWRRSSTLDVTPELAGGVSALALSPDGERAALVRPDSAGPNADIWMWETTRGNQTRVTFGPGRAESPVWMPDGTQFVFASNREGPFHLYRKLANTSKEDEVLWKSGQDKTPTSISPGGRFLLYTQTDPQTKKDIWVLSNPGGRPRDRKAVPFQKGEFEESEAQFSPEPETGAPSGPRFVAYTSNESGHDEVYVREFLLNAARPNWPVSKAGGSNPRWRRDGKELFFAAPDGSVMSVDVPPGATFKASEPKPLVRVPSGIRANWDVTPDGKRFLVLANMQQAAPFTVLQNWQATLKR